MRNCIDQEELQLTKTHMMIQRPLPLTHHPYYHQKFEASIKGLKRSKAPGEDNIAGGILQVGKDAMTHIFTDLFNTHLHH